MIRNNDLPNRIKQPAHCCMYCGKTYKTRLNVDKHILLCELINKSNRNLEQDIDIIEDLPSQKKMFNMLIELASKYNKLEEKVNEINKWVVKKKKKINVIEWLNQNMTPLYTFDKLYEFINIQDEDIEYLLGNSFYDTLNQIFMKSIYNICDNQYPIYAFIQKANIFYVYDKLDANIYGWQELSREKLYKFLNKIHLKICKHFNEWKKMRADEIKNNDNLSVTCSKTLVKIMSVEFKEDSAFGKVKSSMYSRIKVDMKAMVEYEFEF